MTNLSPTPVSGALGTSGISWGWLLAIGILLAGLGIIGLGMTYWLTVAAVFWFGILAVIGGVGQLLDAFHHKDWGGLLWHVLIGIIYIAAGILLMTMPVASAFWLTLFLAIMLVVVGVSRIFMAFKLRSLGGIWIGVLLSGLLSIVLGLLIYGTVTPPEPEAVATPEGELAWVQSWGWVIGLFVAIELIMEGATLIVLSFAAKALGEGGPDETPSATA
ncbi:MAG: HdeD family acid-resistance protein [Acuticoccus sp.]